MFDAALALHVFGQVVLPSSKLISAAAADTNAAGASAALPPATAILCLQRALRQHGLLDAYLSSTTSALLGTQAALIAALSSSGSRGHGSSSSSGAEGDFRIAASYAGVGAGAGACFAAAADQPAVAAWAAAVPAAAAAGSGEKKKDKRQLVKQIGKRMKREVCYKLC
jgi:hypothetical protein